AEVRRPPPARARIRSLRRVAREDGRRLGPELPPRAPRRTAVGGRIRWRILRLPSGPMRCLDDAADSSPREAVARERASVESDGSVAPRPKYATAEEMAAAQREISVAEFFAKNRHLLGFDNPAKAVL